MTPASDPGAGADPRTASPIPFMDLLGVPVGEHRGDAFHARLPWRPALANSGGTAHGGALMSLLDYAMSLAAGGTERDPPRVMTLDMRTSFLRATDGELQVAARCLKRGRSIAFCEASIRDEAGELVATASGTFKLQQRGPSPEGRAPMRLAGPG